MVCRVDSFTCVCMAAEMLLFRPTRPVEVLVVVAVFTTMLPASGRAIDGIPDHLQVAEHSHVASVVGGRTKCTLMAPTNKM